MHTVHSVEVVWDFATSYLHCLEAIFHAYESKSPDWTALEAALAALPLSTEDYGVCSNELRNARDYFKRGEAGAARYELRLLCARLQKLRELNEAA